MLGRIICTALFLSFIVTHISAEEIKEVKDDKSGAPYSKEFGYSVKDSEGKDGSDQASNKFYDAKKKDDQYSNSASEEGEEANIIAKYERIVLEKTEVINHLNSELEALKDDHNVELKRSLIEAKVDNISSEHTTLYRMVMMAMGIVTLFGVGGAVYSFVETHAGSKKIKKSIEKFDLSGKEVLDEMKAKQRNLINEFDQTQRILRLTQMIYQRDFDSETFYSDLTQLSQKPSQLMFELVNSIIEEYGSKFDQDILALANKIKQAI